MVAVNQCSGNRCGLSKPHVQGVEWGYGAMGCARWKGAKLKDILDKAGLKKEAIEVAFDGADGPSVQGTPDFIKSIPAWKAIEELTIVAYEMNGQPLPHLNGFPARLVVPVDRNLLDQASHQDQCADKTARRVLDEPSYRIPLGKFPIRDRFVTQETEVNTPITEIVVNSLVTSHREGAKVKAGKVTVSGLAWDGGYGIRTVQVSTDGGKTWSSATLGQDLGPYAFRAWSFELNAKKGKNSVMVNATNNIGQSQTAALIFNPAGYHNNVIQNLTLVA